GVHGDEVWIAMEFVEGRTLTKWFGEDAHSWREVLALMRSVGEGLAAAHAAGLVHRDVKPENVMIGRDGRARVMDFGLARRGASGPAEELTTSVEGRLAVDVTQAGAVVGTPAYMAPEQFAGGVAGAPADVFAFCVTLWEGLHGVRPFGGENFAELRRNVMTGERQPPPRGSGVPRWLNRVLERGLDPDPERRWADLRALLSALDLHSTRTRRARYAVAALGVAGLAVTGFGVDEALRQRTIAGCEAEGAAIAEVWNDERQASLRRAFTATGKPAAATTADKTIPWLDRWAATWRGSATQACVNHEVDAIWDDDLRVRARACLDESRASFASLIEEFDGASATTLVRATAAAAGLEGAEECLDVARLRERSLASAGEIEAFRDLRGRLRRASSLVAAGQFVASRDAASEALKAAEARKRPDLEAEALFALAKAEGELGEFEAAEGSLIRALERAREAGEARLAISIMTHLVWVVGDRRNRFAEGQVWAEAATTALAMLGAGEERLLRARIDNALALAHYSAGKYEEAARLHERTLAAWEAAYGPEHPMVANCDTLLGRVDYLAGRRKSALQRLERALALREKGGSLAEDYAETRFFLAQALWDRPKERPRALELARAAAAAYREVGELHRADAEEVEAWIAAREGEAAGRSRR
ncbi:MAG: serine/threonine protein kinase, partial [Myxococcales bacterium]|nr:serine/threonine protein kinase [Myxococcales bacterium]